MKKQWVMGTLAAGLPLVALVIVLGMIAGTPVQAAPPVRPLHAPGDCQVTTTADSGPGSLRNSIAQLAPGDTITFSTLVFPPANPVTIVLSSGLPDIITDNVTIDGSSAGVILNGNETLGGTNGLVIDGVSNVIIKGLQILSFPQNGVTLQNGATHNTIGGTNPGGSCSGDCNLISGNGDNGVLIEGGGTLLDAFTVLEAAQPPTISRLTPAQGPDDTPVTVDILGLNFAPGLTATLSISSPQVLLEGLLFIDSTHLRGVVPINLSPGVYTLTVTNPDSSSGTLPNAYEAVDAAVSDDLFSNALDFWLGPASIRQGDTPTMGLIVRRQGGQTPLIAVVNVDFYDGNPEAGGNLIGRGMVAALQPDAHASTMQVSWTPSGAGTHFLYAVIDPDGAVDENNETNNVISRTVTVLPPLPDTTPPEMDTFTINDGATNTDNRQVRFSATAHDNSGGSGVTSLLYIEYEFIQSIHDWVPVAIGDWLPYYETRTDYPWALQPSAGVHYLQVWVADAAGNISLAPGQQLINYLPPEGAHVAQGQVHIYRQPLTEGQSLRVRLTSLTGDADLYVWAPDGSSVGASYTGEPVEWVEFTAETDGVYQIEVEGWTSADYLLEITPGSGMQMTGGVGPAARGRADPLVAPWNTPSDEDDVIGVPSAPVSGYPQSADLALTKSDSPDPVTVGETLTYTLVVANNGPEEATGIVLTDTLPTGVTFVSASPTCTQSGGDVICNLGGLSPTTMETVTIVVTPDVTGTIVNFAIVAAAEFDPDPSNDADSIDTAVTATPDPHVDSVTPDSGFNDQATAITIDGANFQPGATVFLNTIELQSVTFVNASRLQATVQAGLTSGTYDLTVTNPDEASGTLLDAFTVLEAAQPPTISRLTPAQGPDDTPVTVDILGLNFAPGLTATLSISSPQVLLEGLLFIDSTHLRGIVPINVTPGVYTLTVTNPDSSSGMLPDAYEVVDASVSDDLYASPLDLWLNPASIRQGDEITPTMGLIVRRQGGQTPLIAVVNVDFYDGNPETGGRLIGSGLVAALQPDGHASTMQVSWTPSGAGTYVLYAVIDPTHSITETNEANNVISRTVTVLPPLPDTTPPEVDTFTINDGAANTDNRQVCLNATAHDNPNGSGVTSLLYIEYEFIQSIRDWVPVAIGDWLPYYETRTDYPWALQPSAGVHYLQVWVADGAGNISLAPGQQLINYLPPEGAHVAQGQVHIYRQPLTAGQRLRVRLTSLSGDADLYVWAPDGSSVGASYTGEPVEWVEFTAETDGMYQIEVEGWTSADYRLEITPGSGMQMTGGIGPAARGRADPFVAPQDTPSDEDDVIGVPSAPVEYRIYLPVINRNYQ